MFISDWNTQYAKATEAIYKNPNIRIFPNSLFFTRDKWHLYYASMEGVPLEGDTEYKAWTEELNEKFDRNSVDGTLHVEEVTYVYSEQIK